MKKNFFASLLFLFSVHALGASIDFTRVPLNQAVLCSGRNQLTEDSIGVQVVYSPNISIEGEKNDYATLIFPSANSGGYIYYTPSFATKLITNKIELLAVLKANLKDVWDIGFLTEVSNLPAKYPMSVVIGKQNSIEKDGSIKGNRYTLSISGFQDVNDDGSSIEKVFSAFYFKPSSGDMLNTQLFSGALLDCKFVSVDLLAAPPTEKN